jgi:uncharacterized protein YutE (UPF0331/DUF86 family)
MRNGVIISKLQALDEVIVELRSLGSVGGPDLARDWRTRRAVERDLQVLVEVVIDVCQRLLSLAGQVPAATSAEALERCISLGALSDWAPYRQMVQFRNFLVHRYDRVDVTVLAGVVRDRLGDFERFRSEVMEYVAR